MEWILSFVFSFMPEDESSVGFLYLVGANGLVGRIMMPEGIMSGPQLLNLNSEVDGSQYRRVCVSS